MKLSRKKAIALCIELWTWLAKTGKLKKDWPKWEKYGGLIRNGCWFCEYGRGRAKINENNSSICVYCPLITSGLVSADKGCYGTYYKQWENAKTLRNRKKYARLFLTQIKSLEKK